MSVSDGEVGTLLMLQKLNQLGDQCLFLYLDKHKSKIREIIMLEIF